MVEKLSPRRLDGDFYAGKTRVTRLLRDKHRSFGGFVLSHQGRRIYHTGNIAYFGGFRDINQRCCPEIALLPIGDYYPDSFQKTHMGPDEAHQSFLDLNAK